MRVPQRVEMKIYCDYNTINLKLWRYYGFPLEVAFPSHDILNTELKTQFFGLIQ